MDPDEPVLGSASIDSSTVPASVSRSTPNTLVDTIARGIEDDARPADADDEDDDEDGAASVGQVAEDEDESGAAEAPAEAVTAAEPLAEGSPAPAPAVGTVRGDGESMEAIEAAVASLALKQQHHSRKNLAGATQPVAEGHVSDADTQASQSRQEESAAATDTEASTSGIDDEGTLWHAYPKHFFILSSAGKPIYSYNGDEKSLVGLTALISALISVVQSQGDAVQHIRSGSTLIVFMLQGPLYFVAASSVGEPATALRKQLELLYGQLVLIVTTGLERIIQRNPAYDVRSLLDGVGGVLSALIAMLAADASYLLGAYKPLPQSGAVYGLLMADTSVVAMCRAKQQPALHPDDMLLLANFVMCNNAYRHGHGEAFSPVCMPHYNSDAFLHAYIHYLDASSGLYLVLLSGSAEAFHQLSAARVWLEDQAAARGLLARLRPLRPQETAAPAGNAAGSRQQHLNVLSVENLPRPLGGRFGHTALWSYTVRFQQLQQAVVSPPCPLHRSPAGATRLAASYTQLHSLLHSPAAPGRPNKLAWFADSHAVLVAARDRELELYLVCDPLTDKPTAMGLLDAMRRHFGDRGIAADVTLGAPV